MSKNKIKNLIFFIILFAYTMCIFSYGKTIDLNGISVSLNVETNKKQVSTGVDVKESIKYSDIEYEKEEKEVKDESVSVELSIKNTNPYEICNVTITEKVNGGFKQSSSIKLDKTINLKLEPNENKTYKYNYKYNKSFLREQFNKFFVGDSNEVAYDENGNIIEDKEKAKLILEERNKHKSDDRKSDIKLTDEAKNKNKHSSKTVFIVLISFFVVIVVGILFYMFFIRIKDQEKGQDDTGYSKYNDYDGFNAIAIVLILSILVSVCFNNKIYALDYTPNIYEKGQSFTKEVTESVVFNERYYNFTYEIKVKFENKNEITDFEIDTDGDGLSDALEYIYMTDKENVDTDGDGLSDYLEVMVLNYNPKSRWTFNDGINDGYRDFDEDGLRNIKEIEIGTDITLYDTDGDGLSDYEEINGIKSKDGNETYITDPKLVDTDDDGLNDDVEIKLGLDPTNPMTDGITPDSERKIKQELDLVYVPNNLTNKTFPITSIKSEVNGEIENVIKVQEFRDSNFTNSNLIIGTPISVGFDCENENQVASITIDCSAYGERVKKLIFVKYENGQMKAVKTKLNGNSITADFSAGNYGIVDAEQYLRKLNIYVGDY